MPGKKIGLALVGAGGIGRRWLRAIPDVKSVRLVAIVDTRLEAARTESDRLGCDAYRDVKDALVRPDVDAILVATTNAWLSPITLAALHAGKHVLCEKPGARKSSDIQRAVDLARRRKLTYMVGFNHRFHAGFLLARRLFDRGEIGEVLFIRAAYGFGGRPGMEKEWRLRRRESGGGELLDQGSHMLDLARSFLGDVKTVKGFAPQLFWGGDVEDNGFALLQNRRGSVASIHVTWTNWKPIHRFEIFGTKGYLIVDGLGKKYHGRERLIVGKRDEMFSWHPKERIYAVDSNADHSFVKELSEFTAAIRAKREPVPSGRDGYEMLKIVEKLYR